MSVTFSAWLRRSAAAVLPASLKAALKKFIYERIPGLRGSFRYFGERVFFPPGSHLFERVCREGIFEPSVVSVLAALTRPGTHYFDVGANIGFMSIPVLVSVPEAIVVSFEPSPNSLPFLQQTREHSRHRGRWTIIPKAVGSATGNATFSLGTMADSAFEGFLDTGRKPPGRSIVVEATTIDETWSGLGKPNVSVIKSDTEGAELQVLNGAKACIAACRPAVILEWNELNLRPYGVALTELLTVARELNYGIFSLPDLVSIDRETLLIVKCKYTENFLLIPTPPTTDERGV